MQIAPRSPGTSTAPRVEATSRAWWQPLVEFLLIAAALGLLAGLAQQVFEAFRSSGRGWWMLPFCIALGVVLADFSSGVVHWFGDSFFEEESPFVGPMLIAPFREHHRDPEGITHHGPLELHGNSCIPVLVALLVGLGVMPELEAPGWLFAYGTFLCFCVAALATNQCHVWAHRPAAPRLVRALQRRGFILSPERHAVHHRGGFDRSYCITTGWLNPFLDRIRFFPRLERGVRRSLSRTGR